MFASSHYMLERHYYQAMYEDKAIPDNPADGYAPPLLLRLDRNNIHIQQLNHIFSRLKVAFSLSEEPNSPNRTT